MQRIYDFGLHRGEDTELYLKLGYEVLAFEANPVLVTYCEEKFAAEIGSGQLRIISGAVDPFATTDTVDLYINEVDSFLTTIDPSWVDRNRSQGKPSRKCMIPVVDLKDHFCATDKSIEYIKIDIEGVDDFLLDWLITEGVDCKYISIESEKKDFDLLVEQFSKLEQMGFSRFQVVQQQFLERTRFSEMSSITKTPIFHDFPRGCSGTFGPYLDHDWLTKEEAIEKYKKIFQRYRLIGDDSFIRSTGVGRFMLGSLAHLSGIPLPGWYDTHARKAS